MNAAPSSQTEKPADRTDLDPLEVVAEMLHVGWRSYHVELGFTYSPDRNYAKKKHSHIIAWSQKPTHERNQDRFQAACILKRWFAKTVTEHDLYKIIHDAGAQWMKIRGVPENPKHAFAFAKAHRDGPAEHAVQAKLIRQYLITLPNRRLGQPRRRQ